ncbi:uncharacterized protein LOC110688870 [Chenopodium quinoa]|uniref:uncharacterized protein LOC110688870 n=1 Tax=Chenopodium quinoa TaxID=63459 RepID=UPI000B7872F9|nr:uncharacterized protein LOC110688870 [Chenopodium quinoa]
MRDGDKNTAYFHRKASRRRKMNRIYGLLNNDGVWREDEEQICNIVAEYFSNLFSSDNPTEFDEATAGLSTVVRDAMNAVLEEEPTSVEIKKMPCSKCTLIKHWVRMRAFVPGRLITDNALIAFEIFHSIKRKGEGRNGTIALKLDMSKAYDRVEWCFLEKVMIKMGFCANWIRRVMDFISCVSFSFKVNGDIYGSVTPSRGLRQGDPISPYLFLLCADAFSTLISKVVYERKLSGANICQSGPRISHLFFVDDSILFAKATLQDCSKIAKIISTYERASGQKVNLGKTEVAFSKCVASDRRNGITNTLGVREVERHEKYLGLPTMIGRSKKAIFTCLKERIWKKLNGWKERLLSKRGKEVLIKSLVEK